MAASYFLFIFSSIVISSHSFDDGLAHFWNWRKRLTNQIIVVFVFVAVRFYFFLRFFIGFSCSFIFFFFLFWIDGRFRCFFFFGELFFFFIGLLRNRSRINDRVARDGIPFSSSLFLAQPGRHFVFQINFFFSSFRVAIFCYFPISGSELSFNQSNFIRWSNLFSVILIFYRVLPGFQLVLWFGRKKEPIFLKFNELILFLLFPHIFHTKKKII